MLPAVRREQVCLCEEDEWPSFMEGEEGASERNGRQRLVGSEEQKKEEAAWVAHGYTHQRFFLKK